MLKQFIEEAVSVFFFFNDTATTEIYTLSLHDALPISPALLPSSGQLQGARSSSGHRHRRRLDRTEWPDPAVERSEEHTSELQSRQYLVCRLLLEKKPTPRPPQLGPPLHLALPAVLLRF